MRALTSSTAWKNLRLVRLVYSHVDEMKIWADIVVVELQTRVKRKFSFILCSERPFLQSLLLKNLGKSEFYKHYGLPFLAL